MQALQRPIVRSVRPGKGGNYGFASDESLAYVRDDRFARTAHQYVRSYQLIQADCNNLFEYIEPADQNLNTFSFRILNVLMQICIEIETNLKSILLENRYQAKSNLTMIDYKKIEKSHHLSEYRVRFPHWTGVKNIRQPFIDWKSGSRLTWYDRYNQSKHDRVGKFSLATFEHLTDALCRLAAAVSAQFGNVNFMPIPPGEILLSWGRDEEPEFIPTIDNLLEVSYPTNWATHELYDFEWQKISKDNAPFLNYSY